MVETAENKNARERLLNAGAALFAEKGFAGTSVREICDMAGTGNNMIHHYFGSKQGLQDAIVSRFTSEVFAIPIRFIQKTPESQTDYISRFEMFVEETLEAMIENRDLFVMIHKGDVMPEFDPYESYYTSFIAYINAGKNKGFVNENIDPAMLSGLVVDRLGNQVIHASLIKQTSGVDIISDQIYRNQWLRANLDLFLYGLIARQ